MKLEQILLEDVSIETSIRTIADVLSTELPELYRKLAKIAERYYEGHGELGKGFRFLAGGQKTQWYHDVFLKHLRSSLYNLAKHTNSSELKTYLSNSVGTASFAEIENNLIDLLDNIAKKHKFQYLSKAIVAAIHARDGYQNKLADIESSSDDTDEPTPRKAPTAPNPIGQQNATAEALVNDVLSRIDRRIAGEIRQAISRSGNKLQALQAELTRRGLTVNENLKS